MEYSDPTEEGPSLPAERWLYTLVTPNKMIIRTREKPEVDDSQGMRMCPPKVGG